jgi:glutamate racemase
MSTNYSQPIGIFDSGMGGLTVAHAVTKRLPNESIVYFGDTAHAPWGDKSAAAIQAYSIKICDMLLKQNCKLILIACNAASAVAYELVKEYVGRKALVADVIDPMIDYLAKNYIDKTIGLIGTKQTINSNIYRKKLDELGVNIRLNTLATPLLVPLIEEGFVGQTIMLDAIKTYLDESSLHNLDALVLGCTHYPLIKQQIKQFYSDATLVVDSTDIVAEAVTNILKERTLLAVSSNIPKKKFYVSDYTPAFSALAHLFFKMPISLERYPLWE